VEPLVASLYPEHEFRLGASDADVSALENELGVTLPSDLSGLLRESNGIEGAYGLGLVWPTARIVADNLAFRSFSDFRKLYMPFDHLLFFGDAGNGDQFAFTILDRAIRKNDIFAWDHETDSRTWVAPDLRRYLEWWAGGRIRM
jgi:SMI1 / KNR4 family.